jgi:hypothetical protein
LLFSLALAVDAPGDLGDELEELVDALVVAQVLVSVTRFIWHAFNSL